MKISTLSIQIFLMVGKESNHISLYMMVSYAKVLNFAYLTLLFENMLFENYTQEAVVDI